MTTVAVGLQRMQFFLDFLDFLWRKHMVGQ